MINLPLGTKDILPDESYSWQDFNLLANKIFALYGYKPIYTPLFEQKNLFVRGIGSDTDVVSKEMFNVLSDGNLDKLLNGQKIKLKSHFALRPEGTAGTLRAVVQHNLATQQSAPIKLMYSGPMFRAERPSMGRYRQFMQLGVECVGADNPSIDAEAIIMMIRFYQELGFNANDDLNLVLNSMGCADCRKTYRQDLSTFLKKCYEKICPTCKERSNKNPLRTLDCKNEQCQELYKSAPKISDYLCDSCTQHYKQVKNYLDLFHVKYTEDSMLVRGLDYYNRTVFELRSANVGSQDALAGGGRYDGLVKKLGGADLNGFGFALGYERTMLALKNLDLCNIRSNRCDVFVACAQKNCAEKVFEIAQKLRDLDLLVELDHQDRSLKSQFKMAGKMNAKFCVIIGNDEIERNCVSLRNMQTHNQEEIKVEKLFEFFAEDKQKKREQK